jgi:DNA mismatch endonuclease Vsr
MVDRLTPERRSSLMRSVKRRDTLPEMAVRRALHALGYRFRLHRKDLPGTPDIVLPRYKLAIFVHGCFWHRHENCRLASMPSSNLEYWVPKFEANVARDARKTAALNELGWRVETIWECETRDPIRLAEQLRVLVAP